MACARFANPETDRPDAREGDNDLSPQALRKRRRLTLKAEFDYVKRKGKKSVGRLCVLQVAPPRDGMARQAIVISRYFSRRAVTRNRARRLLRVALQGLIPELEQPQWIVLRPRQPLKGVSSREVIREVRKLCQNLNLCENVDEGRRQQHKKTFPPPFQR